MKSQLVISIYAIKDSGYYIVDKCFDDSNEDNYVIVNGMKFCSWDFIFN